MAKHGEVVTPEMTQPKSVNPLKVILTPAPCKARMVNRNDSPPEFPFKAVPSIPIPPLAVARYPTALEPMTMREAVNEKVPSTSPFACLNEVPHEPTVFKDPGLVRLYSPISVP